MMHKKECPQCNRPSYSSSNSSNWGCPVCGKDLTTYKNYNIEKATKIVRSSGGSYYTFKKIEAYQFKTFE